MHLSKCSMQRSTCNVQRATCNMQRSTCNAQRSTCNTQRSTYNAQRSTCNAQSTTCNAQHAARNMQRATHRVGAMDAGPPCAGGRAERRGAARPITRAAPIHRRHCKGRLGGLKSRIKGQHAISLLHFDTTAARLTAAVGLGDFSERRPAKRSRGRGHWASGCRFQRPKCGAQAGPCH
jgi:hypothetical protein